MLSSAVVYHEGMHTEQRTCGMIRSSLMYMRLSTLVPLSSGNCALHFVKNVAISSPFLHCHQATASSPSRSSTHLDSLTVATAIPVGICDLYGFLFDLFLSLKPFFAQFLSFDAFSFFPLSVGEERCIHVRVLDEAFLLWRCCCYQLWRRIRG